jgi:hypothetical protein
MNILPMNLETTIWIILVLMQILITTSTIIPEFVFALQMFFITIKIVMIVTIATTAIISIPPMTTVMTITIKMKNTKRIRMLIYIMDMVTTRL